MNIHRNMYCKSDYIVWIIMFTNVSRMLKQFQMDRCYVISRVVMLFAMNCDFEKYYWKTKCKIMLLI